MMVVHLKKQMFACAERNYHACARQNKGFFSFLFCTPPRLLPPPPHQPPTFLSFFAPSHKLRNKKNLNVYYCNSRFGFCISNTNIVILLIFRDENFLRAKRFRDGEQGIVHRNNVFVDNGVEAMRYVFTHQGFVKIYFRHISKILVKCEQVL